MAGKIGMAMEVGEDLMKNSTIRGAVEGAAGAAEKMLHDTMPASVVGTAEKAAEVVKNVFDKAGYKFSPARTVANDAISGGVLLREIEGPSRIVFDDENKVQHVLFNKDMTDQERAEHFLTAGYAGLIHKDVLAREAASAISGKTAGFVSFPTERLASQPEMQQSAIEGARAYVKSDANGANKFTSYLNETFGARTAEDQSWGKELFKVQYTAVPSAENLGRSVANPELVRPLSQSREGTNKADIAETGLRGTPPRGRAIVGSYTAEEIAQREEERRVSDQAAKMAKALKATDDAIIAQMHKMIADKAAASFPSSVEAKKWLDEF